MKTYGSFDDYWLDRPKTRPFSTINIRTENFNAWKARDPEVESLSARLQKCESALKELRNHTSVSEHQIALIDAALEHKP